MKAIFKIGGLFARAIMPIVVLLCMTNVSVTHALSGPLRVDSRNPHFLTDNSGKSIYLTGTGIHGTFQPNTFGSPNYSSYLNSMVSYGHNLQRMRIWENGWIRNGGSWAALPTIYKRTGPGLATDGKPKFDLNQFNDAFFTELRNRIVASRDKNIYVMLMFFMSYSELNDGRDFFGGHPFHKDNNINGINGDPNADGWGIEMRNLSIPAITRLQETYIRRILDALNDLDNVFYEEGNELHSTDQFENYIVSYVRTYEASKPRQHIVGRSMRFAPVPYTYTLTSPDVLFNSPADWVAPTFSGDYKNPVPPADSRKVVFYDTDHNGAWAATQGMVFFPWKAFTRGMNTIFMDDMNSSSYGRDPNLVEAIRKRLGQTSNYSKRVNLVAMRPNNALSSTGYCLASPGAEYIAYQPLSGAFNVNLLAGNYSIEWLNPATDGITQGSSFSAVAGLKSFTPPFSGEAVLYLKAGSVPTTETQAPTVPGNLLNRPSSVRGKNISRSWSGFRRG